MSAAEHMKNDFYALFELPVSATQQEIRKQFRKLSKQFHPDRNVFGVSETDAELISKKYELINFAYSILVDPILRKEYDQLYFIERQIKGHMQLKDSFQDYMERTTYQMPVSAADRSATDRSAERTSERTSAELQTAFLEKQKQFINNDRYRIISSKSIEELVREMQSARDEQMDSTFQVNNVDDIHDKFSSIRFTQEENNEIIVHTEPIAASVSNLDGASLHSGAFGSPFVDANCGEDMIGVGAEYSSVRQSTVIQVPQSSINTYSIKKDFKHESEEYGKFSEQIPELLARTDNLVNHREKHSAILQNVINNR